MRILIASETHAPEAFSQRAYDLFMSVYSALPKEPVSILPRKREDFRPEKTIIVLNDNNQVLGTVLLEHYDDYKNNQLFFKANAQDVLKHSLHDTSTDLKDVYMISSMAIAPHARRMGIGAKLYQKAIAMSENKLCGIVYQGNAPGRHLARKSGLKPIEQIFTHNMNIINDMHILDDCGEIPLKWQLFTTLDV